MRFIRVHGRVIPIRDNNEVQAPPQRGRASAALHATAVAAGVHALSRVPVRDSDPNMAFARKRARAMEATHYELPPQAAAYKAVATKQGFANTYGAAAIPTQRANKTAFKSFAGKPFVIKPNADAMQKMSQFVTDKSKEIPGKVFKGRHVIQPRLSFSSEYRVTTAHGKVTSITHRRLPLGKGTIGAVLPVVKGRQEIRSFVEGSLAKGSVHPTATGILGIDVGRTSAGLKMIEANVGPGDLLNPIKNIKARTSALGRLPRGLGAALSVAAGIAAFRALRRSKDE